MNGAFLQFFWISKEEYACTAVYWFLVGRGREMCPAKYRPGELAPSFNVPASNTYLSGK